MNFLRLFPAPRGVFRFRRAFTLIELLVVISIIAVLAGLLLPVINKVMQNAQKAQTKSTATQIVASVKAYQADYGTYPVPTPGAGASPTDKTYPISAGTGNGALFSVLRALNTDYATTGLNTRRIIYFEGNDAKSLSQPKNGFVPSTATSATGNPKATGEVVVPGDLLDSWGNQFYIRIDSDFSDAVANPYSSLGEGDAVGDPAYSVGTASEILHFGVIAWSHGYDGTLGSTTSSTALPPTSDDVISWQ